MGVFPKHGNFWIDYYAEGVRHREKVGPSKSLAVKALKKREIEIAEGKFLDVKRDVRILFKDFAEIYIETYAKKKRSWASTDKLYLKKLLPFFGSKYLQEITPFLVRQYQGKRRKEKTFKKTLVSVAYVNRELACLKCMFGLAMEGDYVAQNPVKKVKFEKENNSRTRFLEKEELKKLLECCDSRLRPIVLLAVNTGMRKAEIQNLKWREVDFHRGFITLSRTKNGETRNVPLNRTGREALLSIRKHPESPYIFCNSEGIPYNFGASFLTALKNAEIKGFRFHDLRHTAASYLAMAGVDLNTIREILGHKSLSMVLRYAHLSSEHKANAMSRLDVQMGTIWAPKPSVPISKENTEVVSALTMVGCENFGAVAKW